MFVFSLDLFFAISFVSCGLEFVGHQSVKSLVSGSIFSGWEAGPVAKGLAHFFCRLSVQDKLVPGSFEFCEALVISICFCDLGVCAHDSAHRTRYVAC